MPDGFIFEDLRVYTRARDLSLVFIKLTAKFPHAYSRIRDQIIGAAISVPLNLAEGSGRSTTKDTRNFFRIARASLFELIPLIDIIYELKLIFVSERSRFRQEVSEISKIISALMRSN